MALEGMHPTLRQVPPREPRFSMQAVWVVLSASHYSRGMKYLQTKLGSLDGSNISSGSYEE